MLLNSIIQLVRCHLDIDGPSPLNFNPELFDKIRNETKKHKILSILMPDNNFSDNDKRKFIEYPPKFRDAEKNLKDIHKNLKDIIPTYIKGRQEDAHESLQAVYNIFKFLCFKDCRITIKKLKKPQDDHKLKNLLKK